MLDIDAICSSSTLNQLLKEPENTLLKDPKILETATYLRTGSTLNLPAINPEEARLVLNFVAYLYLLGLLVDLAFLAYS